MLTAATMDAETKAKMVSDFHSEMALMARLQHSSLVAFYGTGARQLPSVRSPPHQLRDPRSVRKVA